MGGGARWGGAKLLLRVKLLWVAGRGGSGQIASEIVVGGGAGWGGVKLLLQIVVGGGAGWVTCIHIKLHQDSLVFVWLGGWIGGVSIHSSAICFHVSDIIFQVPGFGFQISECIFQI